MKSLVQDIDINSVFEKVASTPHRILMLDYDGTLAPFRVNRDEAMPYPEVSETLKNLLLFTSTRLVIVSGRAIDSLLALLNLDPPPEIWGSHGWEHLTIAGEYETPSLDNTTLLALNLGFERVKSLLPKERIEQKPVSVAIHWRGLTATEIEMIRGEVIKIWQPLTERSLIVIHRFDGGLELRVSGRDKGFPVRQILSEMPTDSVAAYLGDDLTDEDAFAALKGKGVSFLVRRDYRPTIADFWLQPPDELLLFLDHWLSACLRSEGKTRT